MKSYVFRAPHDETDVIRDYERQFSECCGVKHGISFGAGRMALYAILEALGIGEGDEVIIPAFTCVVVPNAIIYRGAKPVYSDIEPHFFNIDVRGVEALISSRTKALYAQHTFGVFCDIEGLREIAQKHGLFLIEDGAHALGATYRKQTVGSLANVAFFSTDHSKIINTHLGGMAVTNDDELGEKLRQIQLRSPYLLYPYHNRLITTFLLEQFFFMPRILWLGNIIHAILRRLGFLFYFLDELELTKPNGYPYPCRLSSIQAKLGISQLKFLGGNLTHRRQIATWLEEKIRWYGLNQKDMNESAWLRYSFLVEDRKKFERCFNKHFDLGIWFTSIAGGRTSDFYLIGYRNGSCPVAEYVAKHIVNFPTHLRVPIEIIQREVNRNWDWLSREILYKSPFKNA